MRELTHPTRRWFGTALALVVLPRVVQAHDGTHEVTVRIDGLAFDPPEIEILVGDSVTWINGDLAPHTARAVDGSWDTGSIERDDQGRITFGVPGVHRYVCGFHPQMQGTIVVHTKTDE